MIFEGDKNWRSVFSLPLFSKLRSVTCVWHHKPWRKNKHDFWWRAWTWFWQRVDVSAKLHNDPMLVRRRRSLIPPRSRWFAGQSWPAPAGGTPRGSNFDSLLLHVQSRASVTSSHFPLTTFPKMWRQMFSVASAASFSGRPDAAIPFVTSPRKNNTGELMSQETSWGWGGFSLKDV